MKKEYGTPVLEVIELCAGEIICQSGSLENFTIGDSFNGDDNWR